MDVHNGRFCVTPDYPNGTYCYYATVDSNHNSAYPYVVGPTYYGVYANRKVTTVTETTTTYLANDDFTLNNLDITIFPNPSMDLIVIQLGSLVEKNYNIELIDINGKVVLTNKINQGQTLSYLDVQTIHSGNYLIKISDGNKSRTYKVIIN